MLLAQSLDKDNLHHAYLIEGSREEVVPLILKFLEEIGVSIVGNPDLSLMALDTMKIDDARNLKSYASQMANNDARKVFIISANSILHEAQNSLLKVFEEPVQNTHFFFIIPDTHALLKTFISRFYLISQSSALDDEGLEVARQFISLPINKRIDFIKDLLTEEDDEDEEGNEIIVLDSARAKAMKFLNSLEATLHKERVSKTVFDTKVFEHIFKVREFLRMPGSSAKMLLESLALIITN